MFKKFVIILIILVFLGGGTLVVAASGLVKVPVFSALLRVKRPVNLDIASDPAYLNAFLKRYNIKLSGDPATCSDCRVSYADVGEKEVTLSSQELTSYLDTLYAADLPISDIQVKLIDDNFAEASLWVDLSDYGYYVSGPVYLYGSVDLIDGQDIDINIDTAKVGLLPVPDKYLSEAETELEKIFANEASQIGGYNLESVDITDGQLNLKGEIPQTIIVK